MKIHTGDTVLIIAGKDKGKQGTVLRTLAEKGRVIVEGVNMRVRHIRKSAEQPGQRIKYEASIAASNVMILDPKTKKPTRIGYRIDPKTGNKVRFAKVSGEALPIRSTTKAAGPAKKSTKAKAAKDEKKEKGTEAEKVAAPKKQPFWKRAFSAGSADEGEAKSSGADTGPSTVAPVRRSRESS